MITETRITIIGTTEARMIASYLVAAGARFTCEPQPFERWQFDVRDDRSDVLAAAIETAKAQIATPYLDALAENTDGLSHISPGSASSCHICQNKYDLAEADPAWEEQSDEGGFAKTPCDLCGSSLAGDRFNFHGFATQLWEQGDREPIHFLGCFDCLCYFANGTTPEGWEA